MNERFSMTCQLRKTGTGRSGGTCPERFVEVCDSFPIENAFPGRIRISPNDRSALGIPVLGSTRSLVAIGGVWVKKSINQFKRQSCGSIPHCVGDAGAERMTRSHSLPRIR